MNFTEIPYLTQVNTYSYNEWVFEQSLGKRRMVESVKIGNAMLLLADCIKGMETLRDCSVDLVLTDPPFSSGTSREMAKGLRKGMSNRTKDPQWFAGDTMTTTGFAYLMRQCALEWTRVLKPKAHVLCFIDWRMESTLADTVGPDLPEEEDKNPDEAFGLRLEYATADAIESADLRKAGKLIWDKTHFGLGKCFRNQTETILHFTKGVGCRPQRNDTSNLLSYEPVRRSKALHPTQKPTMLLERLIDTLCPVGGVVLDPFFGSGSTGEAALSAGRQFIGVERDERYYNLAADRLRQCLPAHARPAHAEIPAVKPVGLFDDMAAD